MHTPAACKPDNESTTKRHEKTISLALADSLQGGADNNSTETGDPIC